MSTFEKCFDSGGPSAFRSATATTPDGGDAGTCGFKPLYCETTGQAQDHEDNAARIAAVCREAQARGLREGREEAGRMARAGLAPGLRAFCEGARRAAADHQAGEAHVARGATQLALAAARKVLGADPSITPDGLADLERDLEEVLARANGVTLAMHPDDLAQLQALARDEGFGWPDHPRIALDGDPSLAQGRLRIDTPVDRDRMVDEPLAAKMAERLGLPSKQT